MHLHVLVHSRGHQLPETVGAVQSAAEARLDWIAREETCTSEDIIACDEIGSKSVEKHLIKDF